MASAANPATNQPMQAPKTPARKARPKVTTDLPKFADIALGPILRHTDESHIQLEKIDGFRKRKIRYLYAGCGLSPYDGGLKDEK
jgi:hypothetical protein